MDGYFKPKLKKEEQELHDLELDDCDFISEDEVILHRMSRKKQGCPRCGVSTHIISGAPYCSDCNWDSLTDLTYEKKK
jgi:hypothetical protein